MAVSVLNDVAIDLTVDDDVIMESSSQDKPLPRIKVEHQQEIEKICKSFFGQKFMESNGVVDNGLKMVLEMMKGDQYDNVNEAISDGIDICIDFFHFYQNNPGEYNGHTSDEYICMAEHVKKKLSKFQDDNHDEFIFMPTLMDKLTEMFPNKETKLLFAKAKAYLEDLNKRESNENLGSVVNRIALELLNIEDSNEETEEETPPCSPDSMMKHFPLPAPEHGKYHSFDDLNVNHYYIAASQYYKMLLKKPAIAGKAIVNKGDSIESIEYIVNQKTLREFNNQRRIFKEQGKVNDERKVREILLFHGTDSSNVDSILENNFDIDSVPTHKRKLMAYGRGVYLSEHPEISFGYGNKILLCKVLPGDVERVDMARGQYSGPGQKEIGSGFDSRELSQDGMGVIHVIKKPTQILPYCVINLTRSESTDQQSSWFANAMATTNNNPQIGRMQSSYPNQLLPPNVNVGSNQIIPQTHVNVGPLMGLVFPPNQAPPAHIHHNSPLSNPPIIVNPNSVSMGNSVNGGPVILPPKFQPNFVGPNQSHNQSQMTGFSSSHSHSSNPSNVSSINFRDQTPRSNPSVIQSSYNLPSSSAVTSPSNPSSHPPSTNPFVFHPFPNPPLASQTQSNGLPTSQQNLPNVTVSSNGAGMQVLSTLNSNVPGYSGGIYAASHVSNNNGTSGGNNQPSTSSGQNGQTNNDGISSSTSSAVTNPNVSIGPGKTTLDKHVASKKEYEKRVKEMQKYVQPLQQKISTDPTKHLKLTRLLEIISNPNKQMVSPLILDKCEKTLKSVFKIQSQGQNP